jgi:hypothetical protein
MSVTIARLLVMLFGFAYGCAIVREMISQRRRAAVRNEERPGLRHRPFTPEILA